MSSPASATRVLMSFDDREQLRAAWEGDVMNRRLLVPDVASVEILDAVILDLGLAGEVIASLWAQAVFRIDGAGGGLGLEINEIPQETLDRVTEVLQSDDPASPPDGEEDAAAERARERAQDNQRPMALRYKTMSPTEKMTIALRGGREGRVQVMKEGNPQLLKFILQNPRMTQQEVGSIAGNTGTPMDVLKLIADHPQHSQNDAVRLALVKNPRTPIPIVRKNIDKLARRHILALAKSDHVRAEVSRLARKLAVTRRS